MPAHDLPRPLTRRAVAALLMSPMLATGQPVPATKPSRAVADPDGRRLRAILDGPQRSTAARARDTARHPFETLRFFGLAPAQTVIEISPGGGWYTEILAPYLRERGRLYAAHFPTDATEEYARRGRARFVEKLRAEPAVYDRVVLGALSGDGRTLSGIAPRVAAQGGADLVLTFRNVHNWIEAGHLDDTLRAFHAVLKPGGVLGVEEHRAPDGLPLARIIDSGYVPEAFVIDRARAAGFVLEARSEVNANPRDTKDHANGVWSLPPTLRGGAVGRDAFVAIGESDRMTLKFRKPVG